ncbi:MAG: diguanylate cyclase [Pseudooceanicola sp.]|nr:diguanylate cyclase [Pseudooceanicola sp.]
MATTDPLRRASRWIAPGLMGPPALAFLPALSLATFWIGGETALLLVSLGVPLIFAALGMFSRSGATAQTRDAVTGLILRDGFAEVVQSVHQATARTGMRSALFILEIDDFKELANRHGQEAANSVAHCCSERLYGALRQGDTVARLDDNRFAVCLKAVRQLDLELCVQLSGRMQSAIEEPIALDGLSLYVSCSIGFCLNAGGDGDSKEWMRAAETALADARQSGPSSIRAYSADMKRRASTRQDLRKEVEVALEKGQIIPWFQPQISTDTGRVTGFEALARWLHPAHGMIPPSDFLPLMEETGQMEKLGQTMLHHALTAICAWDKVGADVPCIGVNFAGDELRNPGLVEQIKWALDRFDLTPDRLAVEVLETVVADSPDDMVARNIRGLAGLGCRIDLDDFGTGHASIASIRRFSVSRIKIDRSFVLKADQDPDQQRMIAAILTMAERLGVSTLAEGVETVGEHALLAQLGCDHVQGFGIGRPMPFEQTLDWISNHAAKLTEAPIIGRDVG